MSSNKKIIFSCAIFATIFLLVFAVFAFFKQPRPSQKIIDVPYTSQAPAGNWSEPWRNACEETTIYMVSSFYEDEPIKRDEAIKRIREIFKVKNEEFKVSYDESLATIAELIKTLDLPWTTRLVIDPTIED
ncbi:MAG: papain-like cysteine protease family protein [Patescibacteria group bacterium]